MDATTPPIGAASVSRRDFLLAGTALAALAGVPAPGRAQQPVVSSGFWNLPRTLWLCRAATGEELRDVYFYDGHIHAQGYDRVCRLLRDTHTGQAVRMDPVLLDILRGVQGWFEAYGFRRPIMVNSGYRSPHTNSTTEGAALNSLHMRAKAADIWIRDVPSDYLARLGIYLSGGGVGFYPGAGKGFVHVDSGRLRIWRG